MSTTVQNRSARAEERRVTVISVVIPTQNMANYMAPLFESFVTSGFAKHVSEYIVVNDGSTDETETALKQVMLQDCWQDRIRVISNSPSKGRFSARYQGAMAAKQDIVCFLDSRITLPVDLGDNLEHLLKRDRFLMGVPTIDVRKSLFSLYWERSHEWIFGKHYRDVEKGFYLTTENYEQYAKGTGMLLVERQSFIASCKAIENTEVLADDTLLIREIAKKNPIYVTGRFRYGWEPRQDLKEFLWRLIDRGPGFVEYNFLIRRNRFFYASILAIVIALTVIGGVAGITGSFFAGILLLLGLAGLSVLLITRRPFEVIRLIPLHLLVLGSFSLGVCYGIFYHAKKKLTDKTVE